MASQECRLVRGLRGKFSKPRGRGGTAQNAPESLQVRRSLQLFRSGRLTSWSKRASPFRDTVCQVYRACDLAGWCAFVICYCLRYLLYIADVHYTTGVTVKRFSPKLFSTFPFDASLTHFIVQSPYYGRCIIVVKLLMVIIPEKTASPFVDETTLETSDPVPLESRQWTSLWVRNA